ncbi:hypothetical protein BJY04DRAFT_182806 [Aspergillus karnatakaensis]|uniref:uncharacterized protein n=1 Tax=Aspergillus karnatakaensis TaxID=1810916 RepID=UPI003CCCBC11
MRSCLYPQFVYEVAHLRDGLRLLCTSTGDMLVMDIGRCSWLWAVMAYSVDTWPLFYMAGIIRGISL